MSKRPLRIASHWWQKCRFVGIDCVLHRLISTKAQLLPNP